jgi:signal transduction histidine kinase
MPTTGTTLRRITHLPSGQTRFLLWLGFGGLLLLMGVLGLSAISFLYQIEIRQERLRQDFVERDRTLERLRSNIFLSGTYIRDFLLDSNEVLASKHKAQFLETRGVIERGIEDYRRLLRREEYKPFQQLSAELTVFFETLTPALDWNIEQRRRGGLNLIEEEVLPRRMTAVTLADQIQQVSEKQLETSSQQVGELFSGFRRNLIVLLTLTVAIGLLLAGLTMWRLFRLEDQANARFKEVLQAREELQKLSAELLSAQESERRRLSRELHDQVGQVLSALMLTLGNLGSSIRADRPQEALRQLQLAQDMTEENARVVRNLSLLLRPTMLDDLGLISALKWLAREVSRNTTVQVDVAAEDCPDDLPEEHRTCVYRVVQEAVRNATRHAAARHIRIYVKRDLQLLRVSIQDDGKGFDADQEKGIGILGMKERVARLGGSLAVESERGRGTIVSFELPLPADLDRSNTGGPPIDHPETIDHHETRPLRTA